MAAGTSTRATRQATISQLPWNATQVEAMDTGFTTGAASMKGKAAPAGTPLRMSRRVTGTTPHSQVGSSSPANSPSAICTGRRLRARRERALSPTYTAMMEDKSEPSSRNGAASMTMELTMAANTAKAL